MKKGASEVGNFFGVIRDDHAKEKRRARRRYQYLPSRSDPNTSFRTEYPENTNIGSPFNKSSALLTGRPKEELDRIGTQVINTELPSKKTIIKLPAHIVKQSSRQQDFPDTVASYNSFSPSVSFKPKQQIQSPLDNTIKSFLSRASLTSEDNSIPVTDQLKDDEFSFFNLHPSSNYHDQAQPLKIQRGELIKRRVRVPFESLKKPFVELDRSKHIAGRGIVSKLLFRKYNDGKPFSEKSRMQLANIYSHRPYFTYWISFVQTLILIVSLAVYGFAPPGFSVQQTIGLVLGTNLAVQPIFRNRSENIWLGPSQENFIKLGAKFAPCMRRDNAILRRLESMRVEERNSACCIRTDGSGCLQVTSKVDCPTITAEYVDTTDYPVPGTNETYRAVCGQDPRTCSNPLSAPPFEWSADITEWPICTQLNNETAGRHASCQVTGRPCCVGIQARCIVTTQEHCNWIEGRFHLDATLCSQVSCLADTCGLIPFVNEDSPDQFYRIFTSIFLHAGIIHLLITLVFNFIVLRDKEILNGWIRISIIYFGSGIGGNLCSTYFVPNLPEVGPSGAIFGIIAADTIEVLQEWKQYTNVWFEVSKNVAIVLVFLALGVLPYIDNFAHFGGFIFGLLLSAIFVPYLSFSPRIKIVLIVICTPIVILLFAILVILVYEVQQVPFFFQYFNCIPFSPNFCVYQSAELENI